MHNPVLENIKSVDELKLMSAEQRVELCSAIREKIVETVSDTGGHLGASLGVVELTVALHTVFDSPKDKIIWDVGHQAYGHKLLTGRLEKFHTLRQRGGVSGFPKRSESQHDMFGVGHASTSISAALGYAAARDINKENEKVVAVIGDGSISGGLAFEALNNAGQLQADMILILNDNEMSISKNVGAISKHLTKITSGKNYNKFESGLWKLLGKLPKGSKAQKLAHRIKEGLKQLVVPTILFEELGFKYFGPLDGHDSELLIETLESVKLIKGPVMLHVVTEKGKGYSFAEQDKEKYHGVGRFDKTLGVQKDSAIKKSYTSVFGDEIVSIARENEKIVAVTAAMPDGTGLNKFKNEFPDRFFDVGIAEGHAVTFAAGLACQGLRPVVAIYSTFMQRAYDQVIHDVALQKLPVIFAIDRGGLVGEDGPTHHGVLDLSFMRSVPEMVLMTPRDEKQLVSMMNMAVSYGSGPIALRYPRSIVPEICLSSLTPTEMKIGSAEIIKAGDDLCIIAVGTMVQAAVLASGHLEERNISAKIIDARFLKPLDENLFTKVFEDYSLVITIEENNICGGLGSAILEWAANKDYLQNTKIRNFAIPDSFVEHGLRSELLADVGLNPENIAHRIIEELEIIHDEKQAVSGK